MTLDMTSSGFQGELVEYVIARISSVELKLTDFAIPTTHFSVLECRIVSSGAFATLTYDQPAPMVGRKSSEILFHALATVTDTIR